MTGVIRLKGHGPKVPHGGRIFPFVMQIFRNRWLALIISLALTDWVGTCCCAFAQGTVGLSDTTFRSDASEVRIAFSITDQNNRVVGTGQSSDFAIVDRDLVVRDFRSFARSEYTRVNVALLVDESGSVTPQFRKELANVLQIINGTSGMPQENVSVISFRDLKPKVVCTGNCRSLDTESAFPLKAGSLPPLYDSVVFASDMLASRSNEASGDQTRTRKI